ncbi:MAG TPA: hypothetical protein VFJ61_01000 [Solirubrobacterales bacterium]|nr:hypothetical protein [Solirubrobacterales bacterium]
MYQQLLDKESAEQSQPRRGQSASARQHASHQEHQQQERFEHDDPARAGGDKAPERPSASERRRWSQALAHKLADAPDLGAIVAIVQEHGRPAVAKAAAVRPDLVPDINGEFVHIALSLADLD